MECSRGRKLFLFSVSIIILTGGVYAQALFNGFIWEDHERIVNNATLINVDGLNRIWTDFKATYQYYPLTHTAFWLQYQIFQTNPAGYHFINVLLHALNGIVLYVLLQRLGIKTAFFAALVFLLHPVQVETVAWICELKNILMGLFFFLALLFYLKSADIGSEGRKEKVNYALALFFFIMALLSKTVACVFPAVAAVVLYWKKSALSRKDVKGLATFAALGFLSAGLTIWLEKHVVGAAGEMWQFSLWERLVMAVKNFSFYPVKIIYPDNLSFFYPKWALQALTWQDFFTLGVISLTVWKFIFKKSPAAVAVVIYGILIFPALGFFNIYPMKFSYVADHFQYLACIPVIVLTFEAIQCLANKTNLNRYVLIVAGSLYLFSMACLTFMQTQVYANDETLFLDVIQKNPSSAHAYNNLGVYLLNRGRVEDSIVYLKQAVQIDSSYTKAKMNLAYAYQQAGEKNEAHALFMDIKREKAGK